MIYDSNTLENLPTLDTLVSNLRIAVSRQPVMHRSPIELVSSDMDAFIATRQMSGRFSLKPNISRQCALFRGETNFGRGYTCRPSLFREQPRYVVQNIKCEELQIAMESYPLFNLLRNGILLSDNFLFRIYNPYGIAMCYGIQTSLMSFTSSLDIASFYACCEPDGNGGYQPVHVADGEQRKGILYVFNMSAPFSMIPGLSSVGQQPFERCGLQRTFALNVLQGNDLRNHKFVAGFAFRHDNAISDRIFHQFNEGPALAPVTDILAAKAREIINSGVLSQMAFDRNIANNPGDSIAENLAEVQSKEFTVSAERCTAFTTAELDSYYANSHNIWERFCQNIIFGGRDGAVLKERLMDVPNDERYRQYFNR